MAGQEDWTSQGPGSQTHFYSCYCDLGHVPIVPGCSPLLLRQSLWFHNWTSSRRQVPCIQQHCSLWVMMREQEETVKERKATLCVHVCACKTSGERSLAVGCRPGQATVQQCPSGSVAGALGPGERQGSWNHISSGSLSM